MHLCSDNWDAALSCNLACCCSARISSAAVKAAQPSTQVCGLLTAHSCNFTDAEHHLLRWCIARWTT